jgi:hypothetical protein
MHLLRSMEACSRNICNSLATVTAWYHFTARERFVATYCRRQHKDAMRASCKVPIFWLDIKEISNSSDNFSKIPNIKFHNNPFRHKPTETYGRTDRQIWRSQQPSLNNVRTHPNDLHATSHSLSQQPSLNNVRTHPNNLHPTSHTFSHIPHSDITAVQIFWHVLPSIY